MYRVVETTQKAVDIAYMQKALAAATKAAQPKFITQSKFITWQDVKTWKDPNYVAPEKGPAFRMVRQLLSTRPRTFQEMIDAGLEAYAKELASNQAGSDIEKAASKAAAENRASSSNKSKANADTSCRIPPGHPFISSSFLKKRILTVLESQELIYKKAVRPTQRNEFLTYEERSRSPFHWFLRIPGPPKRTDPIAKWSIPEQWDRLINNEFPGTVHKEYHDMKKAQKHVERERRLAKGTEKRTEREIWSWEGRQPELTTRMQRFHLARRKQKNRTKTEFRRLRKRLRWELKMAAREKEAEAAKAAAIEPPATPEVSATSA